MKKQHLLAALLVLMVGVAVFAPVWSSNSMLQVSDTNAGYTATVQDGLPYSYFGRWMDFLLMGIPSSMPLSLSSLILQVLSAVQVVNYIYFLYLAGGCLLFLGLWRKDGHMAWVGPAVGAIACFWMGSNFTLLYAGHQGKFGVLFFFLAALFCISRMQLRIASAVIIGGAIGAMFMEQADIALFFALFAGAYLLYRVWRTQGFQPLRMLKIISPAVLVALLFAAGPLLTGYQQQVKGTVQMEAQSPQEKWDYVTQWSFPPEELIAFIAPGYTGWRSGEPEGPYWGRMGRSSGWEQTHQGFQNFKLENTYIGIIPVAFALFALFSCRRSKYRAEILFWGGATVIALLLSLGKYFPLYALFYKLPVVSSIRNPNKFLQVFQVCTAILAAYGIDRLFNKVHREENGAGVDPAVRTFFWIMVSALGVLGIAGLNLTLGRGDDVGHFVAQGWSREVSQVIVQNKISALWHAALMAAVVVGVFAMFHFSKFGKLLRHKNWIALGLVAVVAVDAAKLSKHYVLKMPRSYIEANALTDFLKKDLGHQRVALLTQQGIYNIWLSFLLPYNHIPAFNVSQIGRMPQDYQQLLQAGSKDPLKMWRFAGVKYLLAPTEIENRLPAGQLRKVFSYNVVPTAGGGFRVDPSLGGAHAVFEMLHAIPRYSLVPSVPAMDNNDLTRFADPRQPLLADQQVAGSVKIVKYRPGRVEAEVQASEPCTLRAAERWDPGWKAEVDGRPVDVQRIDFICQGVAVPAGSHDVVLRYAPSCLYFYLQCCGYLVVLVALILYRFVRHEEN